MSALDLFTPGAYCRAVGGNLERPDIQKPVVAWMAWSINSDNGRNGDPVAWDRCRMLWEGADVAHFPWLHCRTLADVDRLIAVGKAYGSPAIGLNIEDVNTDFTSKGVSLQDIAQKLASWSGPVHMATLPWVQNGQGWSELKRCVAALEIFPDEAANTWPDGDPDPVVDEQCIQHAFDEGLTQVTLMFKTKYHTRELYTSSFAYCHSLYTADDITPSAEAWNAWKSTGQCVKPQSGGSTMPKIGDQDGIRAAMNRLRALDQGGTIVPQGQTIDDLTQPLSQWKAWDKLERTLQILKDDHDAG